MARPAGFEPATLGLEGRCSIQMSYGRSHLGLHITENAQYRQKKMVGVERFELPTSCSQSRRATRLRYTPDSRSVRKGGMILMLADCVNKIRD
jgi:hypothetical protein